MKSLVKLILKQPGGVHKNHRKGQTLVEYAILLAFISIIAVGVFSALGQRIVIVFSAIDNLLDTAQSS